MSDFINRIIGKSIVKNKWLSFRKNIYSQNGEDGILLQLFKELNIDVNWVCEFGAADGKFCSNTFQFVERGTNAVYIEADTSLYSKLKENTSTYDNIITINKLVDLEGDNTLDKILSTTSIPLDFDILSIDIDSFDYQVWKTVEVYRPKVVVIEINSSISQYDATHIHTQGVYQGTSFLPMLKLGLEKGYTLICHTGNLIFLRNDLVNQLITPLISPERCFIK
jgi:hypothetical protein